VPALRLPRIAESLLPSINRAHWAREVLLVAAACLAAHQVGSVIAPQVPGLNLFWWPAGVAMAALLRLGLSVWPGVWVGATSAYVASGAPLWLACLLATGQVLGPALATRMLRRAQFRVELDRKRDLALYAAYGLGAGMLISALFSTLTLAAVGQLAWADASESWLHSWLGHLLGGLALGVPLLAVSRPAIEQIVGQAHRVPSLILSLSAVAMGWLVFALASGSPLVFLPLIFLPHLLLCWLAARSGLLAGSTGALLVGAGAGLATLNGLGPLTQLDGPQCAALLWAYVFTLSALPLMVAPLVREAAAEAGVWRTALDASTIGVGEIDMAHGQVVLSSRWLAMLGFTRQDFGTSLRSFWDRVHPDDILRTKRAFESLRQATHGEALAECRLLNRDQQWVWFDLRAMVASRSDDGTPLRMLFLARDVGERRAAREQQRLSDSLFQHLNEGLLITDPQHHILQANPTYARIAGVALDEVLGTVPAMLRNTAAGQCEPEQLARMTAALATHGMWRGDMSVRRPAGDMRTVHVTASVVRNAEGQVQNHVLAISDITQSRQQIVQLQRQAHFDELTGLPNRARLTQLLLDALATSERDGSLLTVCYLDLDHFKPVNDQFGHYAGDQLLLKLAERLRRSLRTSATGDDVVARIGGDEFVLLLRAADVDECRRAVERMMQVVSQPFGLTVGDTPVTVTASIGATVFPMDNADAETLLRHADHAMYGAKQAGRSGYQFFDAEHDRLTAARFVELSRVQEALDAQEFRLHYQPKVDMRDGRVLGVEALLRWEHPEQGLLLPAQFLPLIEHSELGTAVGNWVLQRGIEQLAAWQAAGVDLSVSINVSAGHLQQPHFAQHLAQLLSQQALPVGDRLILEVLETTALADIEFTRGLMQECRALGVRFALDDFGTGYSTLTYLKRLPLDMLKIDRSFVLNMLNDRHDMAIVEGVIGLSQTFGCSVVAEGVETLEQAQALIEVGCDVGQGNGIALAMPAQDVLNWVRSYAGMETLIAPLLD
jgi:diguanylate cyclase (GGDEF)-like protein/PAS domain S-box-containing protein